MDDLSSTLRERGDRYGDFSDHAVIAQDLQDVMRGTPGWAKLDASKRQSLTVIADKIARILNGDPEYRDNWHDIQGYAKLAEDRCGVIPIEPGKTAAAAFGDEPTNWTTWGGGERPVSAHVLVCVQFRDGRLINPLPARAWVWAHTGDGTDIVAYRVVG